MKFIRGRMTGTVKAAAVLLLLCLSAVIALTACGGEQTSPAVATTAPATPTAAAAPAATPEPTTGAQPAATQAPADTPTPTQTPGPTSVPEPTATPVPEVTPKPTPSPTPTPTLEPTPTSTPPPTAAATATPQPTATRVPTAAPPPTSTPTLTPPPGPRVHPSLAGYSTLLAGAASNLPAQYDFVSDGLSASETEVMDWADSRLFSNPAFLASKWGPDNWPYTHSQEIQTRYERAMKSKGIQPPSNSEDAPLPAQAKLASAQAIVLLMLEIDIQKKRNGQHVVSWEKDSLDRVLDDLGLYPGICIHCYGKSGYGTVDGIRENYVPVIWSQEHVHREMLKTFAYLARADGAEILARSLLENGPEDFELLYKRRVDKYPSTIVIGSFAYGNVSFVSQIELPDGTMVSLPTMAFEAVADAKTEREALGRIIDYARQKFVHFTGGHDDFATIYRPNTVTPYAPELPWILYVGEIGSPSSSAVVTGLSRAVGLMAEQFRTPKNKFRAGFVEADGFRHHYDGNSIGRQTIDFIPTCGLLDRTLDNVDNREYDPDCDK